MLILSTTNVEVTLYKKNYSEHKTVNNVDFEKYPEKEKTKTVSAIFRNIKRDDLWIKRDLMI